MSGLLSIAPSLLMPALPHAVSVCDPLETDFLNRLRNAPDGRDPLQNVAENVLSGSSPIGFLGDRLWRDLAIDFGKTYSTAQVDEGETVTIRCDEDEFAYHDVVDMFSFWQRVDAVFEGALRLTEKEEGEITLRFPPLTHLEAAARAVYGREAANWVYVSGEIPRDDSNRLHGARRQPIALSREPVFFEQAGRKVHGFPFAFHDAYHAIDVAGIHPELLRIGVTLYDSIRSLPADLQALPFVDQQFHGLAELLHVRGMSLNVFLKWAFVPLEETARRAPHQLISSLERRRLLEGCSLYIDGVFSSWISRLPEERHSALTSYAPVLRGIVDSALNLS